VQFYFLPGAAGLPLILGPRRLWLTFALTPVPLGLFLFIHLTQETPWLAVQADPSLISFVYMLNVVGAYMMILGALVYAFGQTRRAEDALELEYERSERLLHNLLPDSIAQRLKDDPEKIIADNLSQVTILFADIVDFTPRAASMDAPDLVAFLNRIFTVFDKLAERLGLEKIKTIGDAYMVAAGMPLPRDDHATAVAEMALGMIEATERISRETGEHVSVRVGLHTGPAVAGVIGTRKFFYDVWGDTVNTAARMESHGMPGKIQVTEAARAMLADAYVFEKRGEIDVKGKGQMTTWWLTGRKAG
jgi:class 3 adenylate cyclase